MGSRGDHLLLDNAVWESLTGPHARLALRHGSAVRYPDEVPLFAALAGDEAMAAKLVATRATAPTTRKTRPNAPLRRPFGDADCTMQKTHSKFLAGVICLARLARRGNILAACRSRG